MNLELDFFNFPTPLNTDGYFDTNSSTVSGVDKEFNGKEFSGPIRNKLILIAESFPNKELQLHKTLHQRFCLCKLIYCKMIPELLKEL